jgi:hypothetical protein
MSKVAAWLPGSADQRSRPSSPTRAGSRRGPAERFSACSTAPRAKCCMRGRTGDRTAHQLSTATMIALLAAYFVALDRCWPLQTRARALRVGSGWLALTAMFEFGFGRWVAKEEWSELLADYDLPHGRLWSLVLAWTALGPLAVVAVRS